MPSHRRSDAATRALGPFALGPARRHDARLACSKPRQVTRSITMAQRPMGAWPARPPRSGRENCCARDSPATLDSPCARADGISRQPGWLAADASIRPPLGPRTKPCSYTIDLLPVPPEAADKGKAHVILRAANHAASAIRSITRWSATDSILDHYRCRGTGLADCCPRRLDRWAKSDRPLNIYAPPRRDTLGDSTSATTHSATQKGKPSRIQAGGINPCPGDARGITYPGRRTGLEAAHICGRARAVVDGASRVMGVRTGACERQ